MCRSIKVLRATTDHETATTEEVRAAALQYVRKVAGYRKPSKLNEQLFEDAVDEVAEATSKLLGRLVLR